MSIKFIGAIFFIGACTSLGFVKAATIRTEAVNLQDLLKIITYMECELSFRLTPLANLCKLSAQQGKSLANVFEKFAEELENQVLPDPAKCMDAVLLRYHGISNSVTTYLYELGNSFGKFDLHGQLSAIKAVKQQCNDALMVLERNKDLRIRNCRTIGFCTGVALTVILL